jgi:bifunctional DNase/RNase
MIDVTLSRIVLREGSDRQFIFLSEVGGTRGFQIVIGNNEAGEIHRVVHGIESKRPLTHQLTYSAIEALGGRIEAIDIVDLKLNTFYAQIVLHARDHEPAIIDARPSDAIALALRAKCKIRVAEEVLVEASRSPDS